MTRNFKVLGLALVAALALSAMGASSASATFHSNVGNTFLTATQVTENVFTTAAGNVKCNTVKGTATIVGTETPESTAEPVYENCTAFGLPADVLINTCHYKFTTEAPWIHVICPTKPIEITATKLTGGSRCTVTVATQTPTKGKVEYTNEGAAPTRKIIIESKVEGIHYIVDGDGTKFCGEEGKTLEDGKYTGSITVDCYKNLAHTEVADCWAE